MSEIEAVLTQTELQAVRDFLRAVRDRWGGRLMEARLFGSKVRGEAIAESDLDLWLLFDRNLSSSEEEFLIRIESDLCIDTGVVLNVTTFGVDQWKYSLIQITGFAQAIREEGVPL